MSTALTPLLNKFAQRYEMGATPAEVANTLKQTCFKGQVSDAQMVALLIVADQYKLNPFTKELYAFPDKNNGIVPVVGLDGWSRIINEHPQFDGMDFEMPADGSEYTCRIYRKDRKHPTSITEYMSECKRNTQPWQSHPKRMLRHKAMIQCARLAFGFAGIYDQDEAERIFERDVTPAEEIEDVSQSVMAISNATSIEVLQEVFGAAWRTYKSKGARDQLTTAKDERKKFLLDQPVEAEYEEVQDGAA
ncbi:phage recombination protein Bet [Pseudomonas aeruginosa]|uniref:Recombination protein n=1 Tax=Pseudomonas phage vB_Pae_LC3I3 TaxID=2961988 RepID=A0A976SUY2_9CAUD|nr:phage recombination protein Bet [Pseudomonas aeruginosa]YP_010773432.1 recombination protein [Pseudomonas phage vB_Pae_LC3I3]UVD41439.1 recombination protein [Pseudomonas phage vB_Pae_LC3I3]